MNKIIVTTTVNYPTEAFLKFLHIAVKNNWTIIVAGDTKTPHSEYSELSKVIYLHPDDQIKIHPELSELIGFKSIRRRNFAFMKAWELGADVIATVDDDNIPYANWGHEADLIDQDLEVDLFRDSNSFVFDPFSVTSLNPLWHRGYPLELVRGRTPKLAGRQVIRPLVFHSIPEGDPDIDAIARLVYRPCVKVQKFTPFSTTQLTVFNSQNTFIARELLPYYFMHIGEVQRFDDIFGAYIMQKCCPHARTGRAYIAYGPPTVYQDRNVQDLITNLEHEIFGYRHVEELINFPTDLWPNILPKNAYRAFSLYKEWFGVEPT